MDATKSSQEERSEVELILRAGVFEKAPRLDRFFRYICDRHFEGNSDQIKEYSIALEALGRPADFDPKRDSIVRVEAHRLRKRLEEYYRGPGAERPLQIVIPCGQYRPQFRYRDGTASATTRPGGECEPDGSMLELEEVSQVSSPSRSVPNQSKAQAINWRLIGIPFGILAIVAVCFLSISVRKKAALTGAELAESSNIGVEPSGAELRLLSGYQGPLYRDRQGHAWKSDAFFQGGTAEPIPPEHFIEGQPDPQLLRSTRFGDFRYDIPLQQGTYELHLYFAETEYGRGNRLEGGDSTRTFQVDINGQTVLAAFDPLAAAGAPNRMLERVFKDIRPGEGGKLHLAFRSDGAPAMLSGISILPSHPGRIHPVRIVTQTNPVTDSDGRVWAADEYFCGGRVVARDNILQNPREQALYQGERYGNFSYRIPLAPGKYRLTLYFAEQWFGTEASSMRSPESRAFDVFANRSTLLKDFTPAAEAGGVNRTIEKSFEGLEPNAQGMLLLEFVPVRNYAEVNAIELVETP